MTITIKHGVTLRQYLIYKVVETGQASIFAASDAVATTALAHPEWNMSEVRSWDAWEADLERK